MCWVHGSKLSEAHLPGNEAQDSPQQAFRDRQTNRHLHRGWTGWEHVRRYNDDSHA